MWSDISPSTATSDCESSTTTRRIGTSSRTAATWSATSSDPSSNRSREVTPMPVEKMQMKWLRQQDAEAVAMANTKADDSWRYEAKKASDGMWYVAVYDEEDYLLGAL